MKHTICRTITACTFAALCLCAVPPRADAQVAPEDAAFAIVSSIYLGLTTVILAPPATTGVLLTMVLKKESSAHLHHYLKENRADVSEAVALGQGPAVDDLAAMFAVAPEHRADFARMLKSRRAHIAPLLHKYTLTQRDADTIAQVIVEGMRMDSMLRRDIQRVMRHHTPADADARL